MNAPATAAAIRPVQTSAQAYDLVAIADIKPSDTPLQIVRRSHFTEASLADLTADIKTHGVINPILLRSGDLVSSYELVAGERRWLAARAAGLTEIPAIVRSLTATELVEIQIAENIQREDYHELEEALGFAELMKVHGCTAKDLVTHVGKNEAHIHARLKLLDLCEPVQRLFYDGKLNASIALMVARIPDHTMQQQAAKGCMTGDTDPRFHDKETTGGVPLTVADAKRYIDDIFLVRHRGNVAIAEALAKGKDSGVKAIGADLSAKFWKREYAGPAGHVLLSEHPKLGDKVPGLKLIQNPFTGAAHLCLTRDKAIEAYKAAKIALPNDIKPRQQFNGSGSPVSSKAKDPDAAAKAEAKLQAKIAAEEAERALARKIRVVTYKAIRAKYPAKLGKVELLDLLDKNSSYNELSLWADFSEFDAALVWPKSFGSCTEKELVAITLDAMYAAPILEGWHDWDKLIEMLGKRYGVDVAKIRKDLTAAAPKPKTAQTPKPAAAKKPAAKKKAKKS